MSLRKSPTRTPALMAANRANARKSTGPRTAKGKAASRMNRLRHGTHSTELADLFAAIMFVPPGRMRSTVKTFLKSKEVIHPLLEAAAKIALFEEVGYCESLRWLTHEESSQGPSPKIRTRNVTENKEREKPEK